MNATKAAVLCLSLVLGSVAAADASAHRGHRGGVHFGVVVGAPFWYGWPAYYYPPAYYAYYPRPYYYHGGYAPAPTYYVEQPRVEAPAPSAQLQPGYWYFCRESNAYYPHVQQCAGEWQAVPPRPPSQ